MTYIDIETHNGFKFKARANDKVTRNLVQHKERYGNKELLFIKALLNKISEPVCLDIGANIGTHSVWMAKHAKHIYAFEPQPDNVKLIRENLALNHCDNVTVFSVALSSSDDEASLYVNSSGNNGSSSLESNENNHHDSTITVPLKKGDNFLSKNNIDQIDFIKIDVEGHEADSIIGLKDTIKTHQPILVIEWNNASTHERFIEFDLLNSLFIDYEIAVISNSWKDHKLATKNDRLRSIKRFIYKLNQSRPYLTLQNFEFAQNYLNIVLYPKQKGDLIKQIKQGKLSFS